MTEKMTEKQKQEVMDAMLEVAHKKSVTNSMTLQNERSRASALPKAWISALFKKFQGRYGHKWSSAIEGIEELAVNEWSEGLYGLDGEQIKFGLNNWDGDWPPTMPEFRKACLNKAVNGFGLDYVPECYRETKRERILESDENKAKHKAAYESGMAALKKIVK